MLDYELWMFDCGVPSLLGKEGSSTSWGVQWSPPATACLRHREANFCL